MQEPAPCSSNPCKNGGTCSQLGSLGYMCQCPLNCKGYNCSDCLITSTRLSSTASTRTKTTLRTTTLVKTTLRTTTLAKTTPRKTTLAKQIPRIIP